MKILYVEDNEDNIYMLERRLKRAGFAYRYTSAGSVENYARAMHLRDAVGDSRPAYKYDTEVETFFRHSPAVVRTSD